MWPSPSSVIAGSASAMKYVLQKLGYGAETLNEDLTEALLCTCASPRNYVFVFGGNPPNVICIVCFPLVFLADCMCDILVHLYSTAVDRIELT